VTLWVGPHHVRRHPQLTPGKRDEEAPGAGLPRASSMRAWGLVAARVLVEPERRQADRITSEAELVNTA
jgi:hypothetical protein